MPCGSCAASLALVQLQRKRMASFIFTKCVTSLQHAVRMCARECDHAYFYRVVVQYVHMSFFPGVTVRGLWQHVVPGVPCTVACLMRLRVHIINFVRSFVSYSKPICAVHTTHTQLLCRICLCCPGPHVDPYKYCIEDMSMKIFQGANALFFQGKLRHKNFNTPQHFLRIVQDADTNVYDFDPTSAWKSVPVAGDQKKGVSAAGEEIEGDAGGDAVVDPGVDAAVASSSTLAALPLPLPPSLASGSADDAADAPPSPTTSPTTRALRSTHTKDSMVRRAGETNQQMFARIVSASKEELQEEVRPAAEVDVDFLPAFLDFLA